MSKKALERIQQMEERFDSLERMVRALEEALQEEGGLRENFGVLQDYMDSGQWLKDYEADEKGRIPKEIKRGVLSQDALYDLLTEAREILQRING